MTGKINFKSYSTGAIVIITIALLSIFFSFNLWRENRIKIDAPDYYAYLPSVFIYHDIQLNYVDKNSTFFKDKIWYNTLPDGKKVLHHTMGISALLLPFFFIGHFLAPLFSYAQDGYSWPYQNALSAGVLIYLIIGLFFLQKMLLHFFSEKVTALTLLAVVVGTNLLWYSTFEGLMSHSITFSLSCVCMYTLFKWYQEENKKYAMVFFILFGLLVLIRPMLGTLSIYFLMMGVMMKHGIKNASDFLKRNISTCLAGIFIMIFIFLPQIIYWKYITGYWYFNTYSDERFLFNQPQIIPVLFGFRKGWLIYTPIMWFAFIGLIPLFKMNRALSYATFIWLSIHIYILSSLWAWSYGICWGIRTMIDSYAICSIPIAAAFTLIFKRGKIFTIILYVIITLFITLNLFQTWQYKNGLIHFDYMTKKAYFKGFFQTKLSLEWVDLLRPYDWDRRNKGLPQIEYSKNYFQSITQNDLVYFRGYNINFLRADKTSKYALLCDQLTISGIALFRVQSINRDTVSIRAVKGGFLSVKPEWDAIVVADKNVPGGTEKFIITPLEDGENQVTIKASNGKYLFVNDQFQNVIQATANEISPASTFRLFVVGRETTIDKCYQMQ